MWQAATATDTEVPATRLYPLRRGRDHRLQVTLVVLAMADSVMKLDIFSRQRLGNEDRLALQVGNSLAIVGQIIYVSGYYLRRWGRPLAVIP